MRKYEIAVISKGSYARTLRIYAPKHADRAVILHDGKNGFFGVTDRNDPILFNLQVLKNCAIKNTAVIGVDAPLRNNDYVPFTLPKELSGAGAGGGAEAYADFIDNTVVPYLKKRFGFSKFAMIGEWSGALATLYASSRKDTPFCAFAMLYPPLFTARTDFDAMLAHADMTPEAFYYVYTDTDIKDADIYPALGQDGEMLPELMIGDAFKTVAGLRRCKADNIVLRIEASKTDDALPPPRDDFFTRFSKM